MLCENAKLVFICRHLFSMARQWIQMYIKYCLKCQLNVVNKLEKYPHELKPIKVPSKVWAQIGQ